jgi:hypothetical protein
MWSHYVYVHRKADTGGIFYVGKGSIQGKDAYRRAHATKSRNRWWVRTVAKHGLIVEIVAHAIDDVSAQEIEKRLIGEYGRADLGNGCLVNLTDGGDGSAGIILTEEARRRRSVNASRPRSPAWVASIRRSRKDGGNGGVVKQGDKLPENWRAAISRGVTGARNPMFGRTGEAHPNRRGVEDIETGERWPTVTAAARERGVPLQSLHNRLTGRRRNDTSLRLIG